ncbi:AraC family transcriptional regulator of adaptative response/methylated-DNA-[protein]-cysteine methyltransferase [Loktanella ponticola]|uniref:methylated-DNA--[protein]-cysteine S-methyltransferase n=1 Tax=Yoonia ponticola TaxID=1524255 RepID=A0A7W9BJI2_9RHOB|nr:trifunctional transcriptional activator/DNA repair protein Ada/methylated-DNA--[protein]-cysteine S-methyltransferase [Yoonia ponticola]MBB5721650.1 AraC family transcriptional regulator of adaptative response/methylated-DNA-[protein]-cysteine methyltransferase [Yoonia ponticola]
MLFDLPPDDVLYAALIARDAGYDGRAWVGVTTTGIFCRPSCPARKPKPENCKWFDAAGDCIAAGFRPCKRCKPLHDMADPSVADLLTALEADPEHRWSEGDVIARGFDPSTVRRAFKRAFGMTFLDLARQRRLALGFTELSAGRVVDAQVAAGFESASAFRRAFTRWLGIRPGDLPATSLLRATWITTPLGDMVAVADQHSLHLLEFTDRKALPTELKKLHARHPVSIGYFDIFDQLKSELDDFFAGCSATFTIPLTYHGTPFTQTVWDALRKIPAGRTQSYTNIAQTIDRPTATRAVARANGANQIAILIPCHRIIGADGSLTGYGGGLWRKDRLIAVEKSYADKDRP